MVRLIPSKKDHIKRPLKPEIPKSKEIKTLKFE
jgi:hypothetical protein